MFPCVKLAVLSNQNCTAPSAQGWQFSDMIKKEREGFGNTSIEHHTLVAKTPLAYQPRTARHQ